jgi:hypothetical protein
MGRIINVFLVLLMIGGAAATYELKNRASVAAQRVARLHVNIGKEKEAIALLKAEWSVLSQPSRLQSVIERYTDHFRLAPFVVDQVATLDQIPMKPPAVPVLPPRAVADLGPAAQ